MVRLSIKPYWWRSSILGEIDRHCLAVIHPDFEGMMDRKIFGAGTVAHDVVHRVQLATNTAGEEIAHLDVEEIARGAIKRGAATGRKFEGAVEPPLRPQAYLDGKDLAVAWLAGRPAQPGRETEIGITIDRWGVIVDKDSTERWMRGILDLMWVDEERVLVIPDLKTDWQSKENAFHSAQRRIQMMLGFAWATSQGIQLAGIRPEIWNLRTNKVYPREEEREYHTLDFDSMGVLEEWREDILALTDGYGRVLAGDSGIDADEMVSAESIASPGAGCLKGEGGCPALSLCKAGQDWVARRGGADVEPAIVQQPVLWAESARLRALLEPAANELGTLEVGGMECGFEPKPGFEPRLDTVLELWREFRGSQIAQTVDCLCRGQDPDCTMCSGAGKSIDWERELNRQRALLVTFLRSITVSHDRFKKILPKLWPLIRVPKEDRAINKQTRGLLSARLLEPVRRPKWFVRKKGPVKPRETLVETLEKSIAQAKEKA